MPTNAFTPAGRAGGTIALAVTSASARVALVFPNTSEMELTNNGPDACFIKLGDVTVTAVVPTSTEGGYCILSGQSKIIGKIPEHTYIAAITASGTAALYITAGAGE